MIRQLKLKKDEDRRIRAGHLWVFSNEVDTGQTPLTDLAPGDPVDIIDSRGKFLGAAYVNPRSLISARIVSRTPGEHLGPDLIADRLRSASSLREMVYPEAPFFRWIYGEGDLLPGLVVDRYGGVAVVQVGTAGMDRFESEIVSLLGSTPGIETVVLRNDTRARELEGLPQGVRIEGAPVDEVEVVENGARHFVSLTSGQKTGWFYDHRENRLGIRRYAGGSRVLDVFSYVGGWGIQAALGGAAQVWCIDASADATSALQRNAEANGVADRVRSTTADAFEALKGLGERGERFDLIILDPPAFIQRRKDAKQGEQAYQRMNELAMRVLNPGGILVSASCSFHLGRDTLLRLILRAGRSIGREVQILEEGHQSPDHPIHPAIPETAYLKSFTARIS